MRVLVLPILAATALLTVQSGPTETQIRDALTSASGISAQTILVGNGDSVASLDRTEISSLRKIGCKSAAGINAYTCTFVVGFGGGAQATHRRVTARFLVGPGGTTFARQVYVNVAAPGFDRVAGTPAAPTL